MLRISRAANSKEEARLQLEGEVRGPWVEELRRACDEATGDNGHQVHRLVLDLTDVLFVDGDGVALLHALTARHVVMTNCSPFVTEQLKEVADDRICDSGDER